MKKKVLVVGGGYGGLRAVEVLAKSSQFDITIIDQNPYHYLQPEVYGYIAGRFSIKEITIDISDWTKGFNNVKFLRAKAKNIDFENKELILENENLSYDYIILATGAYTNFFSFITGLRENSFGVKKLEKAYSFRRRFEMLIYDKLENININEVQKDVNIAIGGAGLSGVEVAAEMAFVLQSYSKTIGTNALSIKIYLIDAFETILPGMSQYAIKNTKNRLEDLGVNILTGAFISNVDKEYIHFKDESKLKYEFMIFTGGIKATSMNTNIDNETNKLNQLIPNKFLNLRDDESVFGIGDCIEIRDANDKLLPPTAQMAERSAEYVAQCIINKEEKKENTAFDSQAKGVFIALGGSYAVGEMYGFIKVKGYIAYLLKKAIASFYFMGLNLKINAGYKNRKKD